MYACLKCGFVHDGKTERIREDRESKGGRFGSSAYHGYATYRTCPKCGEKRCIKSEPDPDPNYEKMWKVMEYKNQLEREKEKEIEKKVKEFENEFL